MSRSAPQDIWAELVSCDTALHRSAPKSKRHLLSRTSSDKWCHASGGLVLGRHQLETPKTNPEEFIGCEGELAPIPITVVLWKGLRRFAPWYVMRGRLITVNFSLDHERERYTETGRRILPAIVTAYDYQCAEPDRNLFLWRHTRETSDYLADTNRLHTTIPQEPGEALPPHDVSYVLEELGRGALGVYRTPA